MRKFIFIFTFMMIISCQKDNQKDNTIQTQPTYTVEKDTSEVEMDEPEIISQDTVVNDDFIIRFQDEDLVINKFRTKLNIVNKKSINNLHDQASVDTIIVYADLKDSITSYKGSETEKITHLIFENKRIHTLKSISNIGFYKKNFLRYFKLKDSKKIVVSDMEGGNVIILSFGEEKLIKVEYKALYFE